MPNTYSQIYMQIVFAVKGRQHFIKESFRDELQKYMTGIITNKKQKLYSIYCMPDHTHLFLSIQPDMRISDLVRDVKSGSNAFIKSKSSANESFNWQQGFGAFSYSKSQVPQVINYINNQPEHHRKKTFREEYLDFLKKYEIDYNEQYLFEFYN